MTGRSMGLYAAMVLALLLPLLAAACDEGVVTTPSDVVFPDSNVSFGRHVRPVLETGCSFSGCHNSIDRAGGVAFGSYIDLLNVPGLIHPGDSTNSVLWQIVSGRLPHSIIPIAHILDANHRHGIAVWIQEGAFDN